MADSVDQEITTAVAGSDAVPVDPENEAARCSRYADTVVELGYCSRERVDAVMRAFIESGEPEQDFGARLIDDGVISREQARACERALRGRSAIGGFSILEKVGQGGMGTVFRARQISMDRIVAVKILAPKFAQDPAFKLRFLNEARTCAKLSHLNIINGIDCGEDSGYTYFAMEFVEGRTIKQVLSEKGRMEPDEAFEIIHQMAVALSYAKKFGMVHRDIKPDNIMLTPAGIAKLCDLGLAMQSEQVEKNDAVPGKDGKDAKGANGKEGKPGSPKEKGLALGTPHYMSPEQARGEKNIDARSDIYSLGATFYHLIVGDTMFQGRTSTEVMLHHVTDSAPNPCVIDPEIPAGLGMIISKMLAKEAADRHADADALLADLDAVKNGTMPSAATFNAPTSCAVLPPDVLRRASAKRRGAWKSRFPHAAAALALGGVVCLAAVYIGSKRPPSTQAGLVPSNPTAPETSAAAQPAVTDVMPTTRLTETTQRPEEVVKTDPKPPLIPKRDPDKTPELVKTNPKPNPEKVNAPADPVVADPIADPPAPPPAPELPRPELKLTLDILYARFLQEYENRAGKMELGKLLSEMTELATAPAYAQAHEDIAAELADLKSASEFEAKVLKKMAEQKVEIDFSPELARKWEVTKGKSVGYAESRGLQIEIKSGAAFYITPLSLPVELLISRAADASHLAKAQYYYARGNRAGVTAQLPGLPPAEAKRWERKFALLAVKESELTAREAFKNLSAIAEAKSWKTFSEMVIDYQKEYGSTPTWKSNIPQIKQWQELALRALEPPGKWRNVFHAAIVRDIPDSKGEPAFVELVYDFKTPSQIQDFVCMHGSLKIENGRMIVPAGGGNFAHVRFFAPFASITSFQAVGKSLYKEEGAFGVAFIDPSQAVSGPNPGNPLLKFDPVSQSATLENMAEMHVSFVGPPPVFNWLQDTTIAFKTAAGKKNWTVDEKPIGEAKWPDQFNGGWIALWSAQGNQSWSSIRIVFRPDKAWKVKRKPVDPAN